MTMLLQEDGEGQWLIPALCDSDRWNPDKVIDYSSIKAVWLNTFQRAHRKDRNIRIVIEKSPPNMVRLERLSAQFQDFSFLAINRDPYANCSSILYRHFKPDSLSSAQRMSTLEKIAENWLKRSATIRNLVNRLAIPLLTYESFCNDPASILEKISLPDGALDSINIHAAIQVKDYRPQPITNQNQRQIANLSNTEVAQLSEILVNHMEVLQFFGYSLL